PRCFREGTSARARRETARAHDAHTPLSAGRKKPDPRTGERAGRAIGSLPGRITIAGASLADCNPVFSRHDLYSSGLVLVGLRPRLGQRHAATAGLGVKLGSAPAATAS